MSPLSLHKFTEPRLRFGLNQALEDPRDGLTLFGPLDEGKVFGIRPAVIGTADGIRRFWNWVTLRGGIQCPLQPEAAVRSHP
jgi:hypothetical protein